MTPVGFFRLSNRLLKAKDRANLLVVKNALATFGWSFTVVSLLSGLLWLSLAHSLYQLVKPGDKLFSFCDSFNSDSVIFYRDRPIDTLTQPAEIISNKIGAG